MAHPKDRLSQGSNLGPLGTQRVVYPLQYTMAVLSVLEFNPYPANIILNIFP